MDQKLQEKLSEANIRFVHSETNDRDVNDLVRSLMALAISDPKAEVQFYITGGLDYGRAMPIYDALRAIPNPIFGIGMGQVSEFSVLLLAACTHRASLKHAEYILSEPYGVVDAGGRQQTEFLIASEQASAENEVYQELLVKYTKQDPALIREYVEDDKRLHAEEALSLGLIDEIIQ